MKVEGSRPRKQKRTVKQLHAELVTLGFDGSYGRVAAFARAWKTERQREQQTAGRRATGRWWRSLPRFCTMTSKRCYAPSNWL